MKRVLCLLLTVVLCLLCCSCVAKIKTPTVAATTLPVYEFTKILCEGTDVTVTQLITENVSCLHDYTLQIHQMRAIENASLVVISGVGYEDFLTDVIKNGTELLDSSKGVALISGCDDDHDHEHGHNHEYDPHIWLSPANAKIMAENIAAGLIASYPQHSNIITGNLSVLLNDLDALSSYAQSQLKDTSCKDIITFHDGFSYMAEAFGLNILYAIEEESGSEASAAELIQIANTVRKHRLTAIFTEFNGSKSAAEIISRETGVKIFALDMAVSGNSYFEAMYHNIDTLKEALE